MMTTPAKEDAHGSAIWYGLSQESLETSMTPRMGRALDNIFVAACLTGLVMLIAALIGILTRPLGHAAAFWPANALLLGLMLRVPQTAHPLSMVGAAAGYLLADRLTGGNWIPTLWMTAANLGGSIAGYLLFGRSFARDRGLRQPRSFVQILMTCAGAAGVSAAIAVLVAPPQFGLSGLRGWLGWFSAEILNYQTVLPVVLTFPALARLRRRGLGLRASDWRRVLPAVALVVLLVAGAEVGGPGALGFAVPALLWCGLTYGLFTTSLLTLGFAMWTIVGLASGRIDAMIGGDFVPNLTSAYLGIALIALMPVTVASVTLNRNDLMRRLERAATRDFLTDALNRSAFTLAGKHMMARGPVTALMCDLDRFKRVNDDYGHAAGDRVLQVFARLVERHLRDDDLFGRIGGEEFAVLLPCGADEAMEVAERIRRAFAAERITIDGAQTLQATVSIGLATGTDDLDVLLAHADEALYRAKAEGRNRLALAA